MNAIGERLWRSWELFKSSLCVMREHPKLLLFPLLTTVLTVGIVLFFLLPVAVALLVPSLNLPSQFKSLVEWIGVVNTSSPGGQNLNVALNAFGMGCFALLYLVSMFLATFFNVAFFNEILAALNGQEVSIKRGFEAAFARVGAILMWSLLAGLVGLIIRAIEERLSIVGRIVAGLIGLAWSVASIFVIPILVRENVDANPFRILKRSAHTIKQTWGEALVGYVGLQGANILVLWFSLVYWALAGLLSFLMQTPLPLIPAGVFWLLAISVYAYLAGVAGKIYLCALYMYATEGAVPAHYDAAMMDMAWKVKKS